VATAAGQVGVDELLERAAAQAGLDDFGSPGFLEGMELWLDAAQNPPEGFGSQQAFEDLCERAVSVLGNRLRVVDYANANPELREQPVERPIFVLGLPRTGTTLVSYLLDQDPHLRSLLLWEAFDTVPPADAQTLRTDPRALAMLEKQREAVADNPAIARTHWEWADGPTQCSEVHGHDFKSTFWDRSYPVPEYSEWLEDADITSTYEYQRLVLQILQSKAPGVWSLKNPAHALHLDALLDVFPDARLVWTHRDPYRATASVMAPKARGWTTRWGRPALPVLLEFYPRQLANHVRRPMQVRERIGHDRIFDLYYADVMRDPIGEMRRLYAWAGEELSPDAVAGMRAWLDENPQGKYGKHEYSLAELGLTETLLESLFGEYLDAYDIEPEPF
jgi:hypothetical protein